jgi:hypothetical protein
MNHTVIFCFLSALLLPGCASVNNWEPASGAPMGYGNLAWGATPGPDLQPEAGPAGNRMAIYRPIASAAHHELIGVPVAEEVYTFREGEFISASAWIDGTANFERIKDELTIKYGPPAKEIRGYNARATLNNRRGGYGDAWVWRWPETTVQVRLTYRTADERATVTFINKPDPSAPSAPSNQSQSQNETSTSP